MSKEIPLIALVLFDNHLHYQEDSFTITLPKVNDLFKSENIYRSGQPIIVSQLAQLTHQDYSPTLTRKADWQMLTHGGIELDLILEMELCTKLCDLWDIKHQIHFNVCDSMDNIPQTWNHSVKFINSFKKFQLEIKKYLRQAQTNDPYLVGRFYELKL